MLTYDALPTLRCFAFTYSGFPPPPSNFATSKPQVVPILPQMVNHSLLSATNCCRLWSPMADLPQMADHGPLNQDETYVGQCDDLPLYVGV